MLSILEYNKDAATVQLRCRISRLDSPQEFAYEVLGLVSEFDTLWDQQFEHLMPEQITAWFTSEEEARNELIKVVTAAFDEFSTWPQYRGHAYIPGEFYNGSDHAYPPGVDPHLE